MSCHRYHLKGGIGWKAVVQVGPKQVSKKFRRKVDAEAWERTQLALRERGGTVANRSSVTVGELAAKWLEDHSRQRKAASSYERDRVLLRLQILPAFGNVRLSSLLPAAVEAWMVDLRAGKARKPISAKTCNHALTLFKKMLNDAVRWSLVAFNPIQYVAPFKIAQAEYRFWSKDEALTFLEHVAVSEPARYPLFALALNTGMRRGELRALRWESVSLDQKQITVKSSWCDRLKGPKGTKSGKIRQVPINSDLLSALVELRTRSASDYVLGGINFPLNATREMPRLCKAAGVTAIRFHDLRHTFASHFMMAGGKVYDLQKLLGHSTIQMTEKYSHLSPDHLKGTTDILSFGVRRRAEVVKLRKEG